MLENQNSVLLQNEARFIVQPSLARAAGIKGALVLQYIHQELVRCGKIVNGRMWIEGPLEDWHARLSFMNFWTMKDIFQNLCKKGFLITTTRTANMDRTKWYTINYEKIASLLVSSPEIPTDDGEGRAP